MTCPWRALYDPLVGDVIAAVPFIENGNLATRVGSDPPAILVDAIEAYRTSLMLTRNENDRIAMKNAEAKAKADAKRK